MLRADGDFPSETVENIAKAFVAFMTTIEGEDTIAGAGAVALATNTRWDDIKSQFPVCDQDNSAVTVRFGGSDSIEKVAKAVTASFRPRCGNFVAEHEHTVQVMHGNVPMGLKRMKQLVKMLVLLPVTLPLPNKSILMELRYLLNNLVN